MELKIGTDPECAIYDTENKMYVSAHDLIPGDKNNPFKVEKGAVQVDGLAAEFNIDPATTAEEFDNNISSVINQLTDMIKKKNNAYELKFIPFVEFNKKYFETIPSDNKILGCDPDYNALNGNIIDKKIDITNMPLRTMAGHVHIGFSENEDLGNPYHLEDCRFIAEYFYRKGNYYNNLNRYDTFKEIRRLQYYGSSGAYRPKSYGVELRQFSNIWVAKSETRKKMFNYIVKTMQTIQKNTQG